MVKETCSGGLTLDVKLSFVVSKGGCCAAKALFLSFIFLQISSNKMTGNQKKFVCRVFVVGLEAERVEEGQELIQHAVLLFVVVQQTD